MARTKTYTVEFEKDEDGWWVATVPSLPGCHTQGRTIAQARTRIIEAMALHDVGKPVTLKEEIRIGSEAVQKAIAEVAAARAKAAEAAEASAVMTKHLIARLAKAGVSRRDIGDMLGISFQRVQQLVK